MARSAGDVTLLWPGDPPLTFTSVNSLASDANLIAGAESGAYVCSAIENIEDVLISAELTTHNSVAPTDNKTIELWVIPALNDTPTWPDVFDGTDSTETVTDRDTLATIGRCAGVAIVNTTTGRAYGFAPVSVASLFGGALPERFVAFVVQDTGQALHSTGNAVTITVIYRNIQG